MTQVKPVYKSHGEEFDTPEAAERHSKIYDAGVKLREAWDELRKLNFDGYKTADGQPLNFDRWRDYYVVRNQDFHIEQRIERVSLNTDRVKAVEVDGDDIIFYVYVDDTWNRAVSGWRDVEFRLSEIYATEEAAEKKRVEIIERNIAWLQEDLDKKKKRLKLA